MHNRLGEALRFAKHLPNIYRGHVLELQRRFNGLETDQRVLYFTRRHFLVAPNDVTSFRVWQDFFARSPSATEVAQFLRLRRGCQRFLDIGAAQGLFSAMFCRSADGPARVVAVEPTAAYAAVLRETLALNAGAGVDWSIQQMALMDQADQGRLGDDAFDGFFAKQTELVDPEQQIEIATLDSLCTRLGFEPDLIKLDVDGFEYEILLGSPDFLRRCPAKVHLELHFADLARRGKDVDRILDLLNRTHAIASAVPSDYRQAPLARLSLVPNQQLRS